MKRSIYSIITIYLVSWMYCPTLYGLSDDSVLNAIMSNSNLTQSDVDKWKVLSFGPLAQSLVGVAGVYGTYKAGKLGYDYAGLMTNVFKNVTYPYFFKNYEPSETIQETTMGKWVWAGVGVMSVGIGVYKLLYSRMRIGTVNKIKKYTALCDRLVVAHKKYETSRDFQTALEMPGNKVWVISNPLAKSYGFKNLIDQANVALLLLDQLQVHGDNSPEVQLLQGKIINFKDNLEHNLKFILPEILQEEEKRLQQQASHGKQVEILSKEVAAETKRMKNVNDQWKLLKDFAETSHKYGPAVATGVAGWNVLNWLYPTATFKR